MFTLTAQLVVITSDGQKTNVSLSDAQTWNIGRGENSDIVLSDHTASRLHATIRVTAAGDFCLKDAGSHNGTFVNGEQIHDEVSLNENDEIRIGSYTLMFLYSLSEEALALVAGGSKPIEDLLTQTCSERRQSPEELLELVYAELRQVARAYMRRERPDHTLQATALVHEAYIRLFQGQPIRWENRKHLFCMIARSMRRVLVDHARACAAERHGGAVLKVSLDDQSPAMFRDLSEVLTLDEALAKLAQSAPRQAQVVELHFFGGLTEEEVAELLGVSLKTVKNDWRFAKARLKEAIA